MTAKTRDDDRSSTSDDESIISPRPDRAPDKPTQLGKKTWWSLLKRTFAQFKDDNLTDLAAALTYYGVLAIFPGFLVLVAILGLIGKDTATKVVDNVKEIAPGGVATFVETIVKNVQNNHTGAGFAAVVGLAVALWSASGYVAAFMRASNTIYDIGEGRPLYRTLALRIGLTIFAVVVLVLCAIIVVVSGPVARQIGDIIGVGDTAVTVWNIAKWPVLLVIVTMLFAVLFWASPNAKQGGIRWITPGGVLATVIWLVLSGLFAVYVANFSSYNKTYGTFAGVIIFLVWLWVSNVALLLGQEFNAELEHQRAIEAGLPPDVEPFVQPRDTKKLSDTDKRRLSEAQEADAAAEHSNS